MGDQSIQEKDNIPDFSGAHRLSESRPKFKPVLVKKLLADESDDDSDDQISNTEYSEEEFDDFDGFQPLSEECTTDLTSTNSENKTDVKINIEVNNEGLSAVASSASSVESKDVKVNEEIELSRTSDSNIRHNENEQKSLLNTYLKDSLKISEYTTKKNEENFTMDKPSIGAKRKSSKDIGDVESATIQSHWQPQSVTSLDKRKSLPIKEQSDLNIKPKSYSPDVKRHLHNTHQLNEVKEKVQHVESFADLKDRQELHKYSSANIIKSQTASNETNGDRPSIPSNHQLDSMNCAKVATLQTVSSATQGVMNTPMKHPQGTARPTPCLSHRNIFQTPQSKIGNEFAKNPMQTPATIFSHWSQQHLSQTPMQNNMHTSRDTMQTPAQSQSERHETPRYFTGENKSVRRPLAETMYSSSTHGSHLPRLQEIPNEFQPSPPISRDNSNATVQESAVEKKPLYSSSQITHDTKENRNPNSHDIGKSESQPKSSVSESRHSVSSLPDNKQQMEYHGNAYNSIQAQRKVENYESYHKRDSLNVHTQPATNHPQPVTSHPQPVINHPQPITSHSQPLISHPQPVTNQPQQMQTIQCSIPQQTNSWNSRQNKVLTINGRHYLVLGVLGQGMSCEVVRVQDLATSELRAVKCVNLSKMDKDSVEGCLQEICLLDKLKAPCIVHMYNFEIKQPWVHVVMEVGDTDLSRLLKSMLQEKKKIPLTMILYYWTEMLTAVKHIHENGVIHSDLKPANFLLVRGRLKLIDFGIASNINADMTSVVKNCPIGTLNYISPEALMDVSAGSTDSPNHNVKYKISYKSDVWSLGCILYGLVYGVTPFNHIRQQWAKISAITDPKHKINFSLITGSDPVPLILIDVMRKCLQRDPKARPTVADLLNIPYLQSNVSHPIVPNIPGNILMKIKHALAEDEWKKFTELLDRK